MRVSEQVTIMYKRSMIAILSFNLMVSLVSSEVLGKGAEDSVIKGIHDNILIGELSPSGNVYLERFSLNGGYDNQQHFDGFNYSKELTIYPIKRSKWTSARASFGKLIKATYIGNIEKSSKYFLFPFSEPLQDALLYKVKKKIMDKPITIVSINNYEIDNLIHYDGSMIREHSDLEYKASMKRIREDHELKDKYDTTLSKITEAETILNAKKAVSFRIKKTNYDVLLSTYMTHGSEYASTVYVIDFIQNGKRVLTMEKYNTDGPF